jgi:uncharacterized protein YggT (Ycf19 family)
MPQLTPLYIRCCCCVQITEPYLQIYRGILPPLFGQLDFTPLFGFLILQVRRRGSSAVVGIAIPFMRAFQMIVRACSALWGCSC